MIRRLSRRVWQSGVAWSWVFNGVRLVFGLLLLPLLVVKLSDPDFGMYQIFANILQMLPLVDATLSFNVGRQVTFAMGGATRLLPLGTDPGAASGSPNYPLIWRLVRATGVIYGAMSVAVAAILAILGGYLVSRQVAHTSQVSVTWLAWWLTVLGAAVEIQSLRWLGFLRNMNVVTRSAQLGTAAYILRVLLACAGLLAGGGLLSVPIASIVTSLLLGWIARRTCLRLLPGNPPVTTRSEVRELLGVIWPNSWRTAVKLGSEFVTSVWLLYLGTEYVARGSGLRVAAQYQFSIQLMTIVQQLAMVWTQVKWPMAGQLRAQKRLADLRRLLWSRAWLQNLSCAAGVIGVVVLAQPLLRWSGTQKEVLPVLWLALLGLNQFLYLRYAFWVFLIATDNRIPSLWPAVITNLAAALLATALVFWTDLGLGALVLAPLLAGLSFNYWYWMFAGARDLGTTWWRFVRAP